MSTRNKSFPTAFTGSLHDLSLLDWSRGSCTNTQSQTQIYKCIHKCKISQEIPARNQNDQWGPLPLALNWSWRWVVAKENPPTCYLLLLPTPAQIWNWKGPPAAHLFLSGIFFCIQLYLDKYTHKKANTDKQGHKYILKLALSLSSQLVTGSLWWKSKGSQTSTDVHQSIRRMILWYSYCRGGGLPLTGKVILGGTLLHFITSNGAKRVVCCTANVSVRAHAPGSSCES